MKPHWIQTAWLLLGVTAIGGNAQTFKTAGSVQIGGNGGWDYLHADAENRRLYVSHGTEVVVVDLDSQQVVTKMSGFGGIHGIFPANDLGKGFITDGRMNQVVVFDLKTNAIKSRIPAGTNPDGAVYDPASQRLFAFNGRSSNATVIDAKNESVVATIPLDGKPEFPVADGKGHVYVNIEDKSEIVKIDSKNAKEIAKWPLSPCESPSGLTMDPSTDRLFTVCDNKIMAVVDGKSGRIIATPAIGEGPDAARFDPELKLIFSSNGESGNLTVIHEDSKNKYTVVQTVPTVDGARTMALDEKTHTIYLSCAKYGPPGPNAGGSGRPRRSVLPGTFKLLVVKQ